MFLITPKSKSNGAQAPTSQPAAKIRASARVHAACDRCRMKKVKCDGYTPCLRCSQDDVVCIASGKMARDPKAASFEYIRSMEAQQSHLIKALTAISRHVRQPVGEGELKEILETVKKCGFDFEGAGEYFNITKPVSEIVSARESREPTILEGETALNSRKRKRREGTPGPDASPTTKKVADSKDDPSHMVTPGTITGALQDGSTKLEPFLEPFDDYWNLESYWEQVAAQLQLQCIPTTDSSKPSSTSNDRIAPFQDQTESLNWMLGDICQSQYNPDLCPQSMVAQSATSGEASIDLDVLFSSFTTFNQPEWDSTLWWDPSSLFNMEIDTSWSSLVPQDSTSESKSSATSTS